VYVSEPHSEPPSAQLEGHETLKIAPGSPLSCRPSNEHPASIGPPWLCGAPVATGWGEPLDPEDRFTGTDTTGVSTGTGNDG